MTDHNQSSSTDSAPAAPDAVSPSAVEPPEESETTTDKEKDEVSFREVFAIVFGIGLAVIILASIWFVVTQPEFQWRAAKFFGFEKTAEEIQYGKENAASSEGTLGERGDHSSVINWVLACTNSQYLAELPAHVRRMYTSNPRLVSTGTTASDMPNGARVPNRYERAFLQLSNALANQRTLLRTSVKEAYVFWQWCAVVTILLGFATTVLVTISSTEFGTGDGNRQKLIRVLAITFPALGTAAAAVVAFYGPQAEWNQSSRTLTSVSQLHSQMALDIWKLNCVESKNPDENAPGLRLIQAQLDDWSKRYVDIQIIASASSQSSPATSSSSSTVRDPSPGPSSTSGATPPKQ